MSSSSDLDELLQAALAEDLGATGDLTSAATIGEDARASARIVARESGTISGLTAAARVFELLDRDVRIVPRASDGDRADAGAILLELSGSARSLLSGERLALNLLGQLSGVATATRALVDAVEGTGARILDTRKTVPLLRALQKAAVRHGGGENHRMGLYDAVLIKDNHIEAGGSAADAVRRARASVGPGVEVEVEIDSVDELDAVVEAGADIVLLDNMSPDEMRAAVTLAGGRCTLEASGGITLDSVRTVAETGVDTISAGWLTHSAPALDVAMEFEASPMP